MRTTAGLLAGALTALISVLYVDGLAGHGAAVGVSALVFVLASSLFVWALR